MKLVSKMIRETSGNLRAEFDDAEVTVELVGLFRDWPIRAGSWSCPSTRTRAMPLCEFTTFSNR
jgi:hypothetical protein